MYWHALLKWFLPIVLCCTSMQVFCFTQESSNVLMTQDYGILSQDELAAYTRDVKPALYAGEIGRNYPYWQCFPRAHVTITLIDKGYSSEDIGKKDNYGDLFIHTWSNAGISNEYSMRRPWAVGEEEEIFHRWQVLMKHEKYVCLAGSVGRVEEKTVNHKHYITYFWVFERIKTKKGCNSYFEHQCDPIN